MPKMRLIRPEVLASAMFTPEGLAQFVHAAQVETQLLQRFILGEAIGTYGLKRRAHKRLSKESQLFFF